MKHLVRQQILAEMKGKTHLMASLLYGTRMRLTEMLRLRVKDLDFTQNQIVVREGKGNKDRVTMLPLVTCDCQPAIFSFRVFNFQSRC